MREGLPSVFLPPGGSGVALATCVPLTLGPSPPGGHRHQVKDMRWTETGFHRRFADRRRKQRKTRRTRKEDLPTNFREFGRLSASRRGPRLQNGVPFCPTSHRLGGQGRRPMVQGPARLSLGLGPSALLPVPSVRCPPIRVNSRKFVGKPSSVHLSPLA